MVNKVILKHHGFKSKVTLEEMAAFLRELERSMRGYVLQIIKHSNAMKELLKEMVRFTY